MADRANISSVDALRAFKASLIVYVSKARPTLEEVSAEAMRTRLWLENDQRTHWEGQIRRRRKKLEEAQEALFSAKLSNLQDVTVAEQFAFRRAKGAVDEAEEKLKRVKHWSREFESRAEPLTKQLGKLHTVLSNDLLQAIAYLTEAANTLDAYSEQGPSPTAANPTPPEDGIN
ncbi:MAG: hypothetical protein JWR19_1207 [Pedosphaera sp.]|nr:hypothetical protein [Pedosphaera sp.]